MGAIQPANFSPLSLISLLSAKSRRPYCPHHHQWESVNRYKMLLVRLEEKRVVHQPGRRIPFVSFCPSILLTAQKKKKKIATSLRTLAHLFSPRRTFQSSSSSYTSRRLEWRNTRGLKHLRFLPSLITKGEKTWGYLLRHSVSERAESRALFPLFVFSPTCV